MIFGLTHLIMFKYLTECKQAPDFYSQTTVGVWLCHSEVFNSGVRNANMDSCCAEASPHCVLSTWGVLCCQSSEESPNLRTEIGTTHHLLSKCLAHSEKFS